MQTKPLGRVDNPLRITGQRHQPFRGSSDRRHIAAQRIACMRQTDPRLLVYQNRAGQTQQGRNQPQQSAYPAVEEIKQFQKR